VLADHTKLVRSWASPLPAALWPRPLGVPCAVDVLHTTGRPPSAEHRFARAPLRHHTMSIPPTFQVIGDSELPLWVAAAEVNETRYGPLREKFPEMVFLNDVLEEVLPGVPAIFLGPIEQVRCHLRE